MSWQPGTTPKCNRENGPFDLVIKPKAKELGGFSVRRVLPSPERRAVGPFVFFDHIGPADFPAGKGIDVRPHPHIGLSTLTYLFDGEITHRDSLDYQQSIRPGAVNLMTAGKGIVHSERTGAEVRSKGHRLHGLQTWMALPKDMEETDPSFRHYSAQDIPETSSGKATVRVICGKAFGAESPVKTPSPMLYVDIRLPKKCTLEIPSLAEEQALYIVKGSAVAEEEKLAEATMAIFGKEKTASITANNDCRMVLIGGPTLDGPRHIWWNFVSSSKERIETAKADWKEGNFDSVPGDTEFIPLPE